MTRTYDDSEPTDHRQASDGTADSGATSSTPSPSPGNDSPTVPRSAGQLERAVRKFSRTRGLAERRVRDWISYMALGGRLEAASHARGEGPLFTFKGGVVMELRRRGAARATQDLDLTYLGAETDIVLVMQDAVAEPYGRFSFRLSGTPREMANVNTTRVELAVRFDGTRWGTVVVDVSRGESHAVEVEFVPAFDLWRDFGVAGPTQLPCLSARYHLAHKLHGMTKASPDGASNARVQDAIDALLFRDIVTDMPAAYEACVDVFASRKQHGWPPMFEPPESWGERFAAMAESLGLEVRDLASATATLREFVREIDRARRADDR